MVHALREAHRVLAPNGIVLDLRPAAQDRRVGIILGNRWHAVETVRERFDNQHAADAAVAHVVGEGLFRQEERREVDLLRSMETVKDFQTWIDDAVNLADWPPRDWLIERLEQAIAGQSRGGTIAVRGPLHIGVMRKTG